MNPAVPAWTIATSLGKRPGGIGRGGPASEAPVRMRLLTEAALKAVLDRRPATGKLPVERAKIERMLSRAYASVRRAAEREGGPASPKVHLERAVKEAADAVLGEAGSGRGGERARGEAVGIVRDAVELLLEAPRRLGEEVARIEKAARDFEAVFARQLIDAMRKTVDEQGLLGDATGKQMRDMYFMFLGDEIGKTGSLGLWRQIASELAGHGGLASLGEAGIEVLR